MKKEGRELGKSLLKSESSTSFEAAGQVGKNRNDTKEPNKSV